MLTDILLYHDGFMASGRGLRPASYVLSSPRIFFSGLLINYLQEDKQMTQILTVRSRLLPCDCDCADQLVVAPAEAGQKEIFSSWALFILITLLILALFTSYILQSKKIQAVHETVISIIAGRYPIFHPARIIGAYLCIGMFVGLVIRVSPGSAIQDSVTFNYQFFFNLLLPPIILASGYELHQVSTYKHESRSYLTRYDRRIFSGISVQYSRLPSLALSSLPLS